VLTDTGRSGRQPAAARSDLRFGREHQTVTGLHLDRSHAFADQGIEARQGLQTSSSSVAACCGTVETMPPPAFATSS
jgi:hypothetical protein